MYGIFSGGGGYGKILLKDGNALASHGQLALLHLLDGIADYTVGLIGIAEIIMLRIPSDQHHAMLVGRIQIGRGMIVGLPLIHGADLLHVNCYPNWNAGEGEERGEKR